MSIDPNENQTFLQIKTAIGAIKLALACLNI